MKIKDGYLLKKVAGSHVVVPVNNLDFDGMISLNESGAFLWNQLQNDRSLDDLITALSSEYDISATVAENDTLAFLNVLRKENILHE